MDDRLKKVLEYIDAHQDEYVALLRTFCRQPSVAATGEGIEEMSGMVFERLKAVGANPQRFETGGSPILYGHVPGENDRIFGFYNHYDVQPVDPIDEWLSDPYAADIRDGFVYARGVVDNKGPLVSRLCAVQAWQKVHGVLPLHVKFLVEGEEEVGSPHLVPFAKAHPDVIQCDGYLWEGSGKDEDGPPEIVLGVKGILCVELRVRTSEKDAHSMNAAVVESAPWRLIWALSTLKDQNETILIDGFYDDVKEPTQDEIDALSGDLMDEEQNKKGLGIEKYLGGMTGVELLKSLYYKPTCNICGLTSGYQGQGSKTVLPAVASAKLDFRLVPSQTPDRVLSLLRAHLDRHGFSDIEIIGHSGGLPYRSDPNAPFCRAAIEALETLYQKPARVFRNSGGTSPMYAFCAEANIPAAMFGATNRGANIHAPNEHLGLKNFIENIKITAAVMDSFSR